MKRRPNFKNVHILLADSDGCLAQAAIHNLRALGFPSISHVRNVHEAVTAMRTQAINLLITEWEMKGTSGIDLVQYLRRGEDSPNRALPILMLTGRGEANDVEAARDAGITEFVVKPFSAQALYNRIEKVIDHPRSFVVSKDFVGPERRRRGMPPPGMADRRTERPIVASHSREALKAAPSGDPAVIFTPDFSLRQALGSNRPFASLITADILEEAQQAIDSLEEDSMQWIRQDLAAIKEGYESLQRSYSPAAFEDIKDAALSIKARGGTFGYRMASDVARLLFLFLGTDFRPTNPRHLIVIEKHVEVLTVIFARKIKEGENLGAELYAELQRLIATNK